VTEVLWYDEAAASTALYASFGGVRWPYPVYGFAGETGEIAEKVERLLAGHPFDPAARAALYKELGDVLWYASRVAAELGSSLTAVLGVASFAELVGPDRAGGDSFEIDVARRTLRVVAGVGVVSERIKKVLRDQAGVVDTVVATQVLQQLRYVVAELAGLAEVLGTSLAAVAEENAAKLASRRERDRLHGDGDHR
jgi:NTP pyrophosphatase (non-canonical NTP hydrolase)